MRRFKKLLSLFFVVVLCVCFAIPASAEDLNVDAAFDFAKEFLSEYYFAKDQCADYDFSRFIDSPRFLEYVTKKTAGAQYYYLVHDEDDMQNYELEMTLWGADVRDGFVIFNVAVSASFNYKVCPDTHSEYGDSTFIIVTQGKNGFVISDWYTELVDSFDLKMRGELTYIDNPNYWDIQTISSEVFSTKIDDITASLKQWYLDMLEPIDVEDLICDDDPMPASAEDLDVDAAYAFATELLSEYYYAKDQAADYDFTRFTDNPRFLEFLNKKTETAQLRYLVYDKDDKQDYKLTFKLENTEFGDGYVIFEIVASSTFRYKTAYGFSSGLADRCFVIVSQKDDSYVISDWYEAGWASFEAIFRGELWSISDPNYWEVMTISNDDFSAMLDEHSEAIKQNFLREHHLLDTEELPSAYNITKSEKDLNIEKTLHPEEPFRASAEPGRGMFLKILEQ